jgi:iron complex transport system substrate-binding protein
VIRLFYALLFAALFLGCRHERPAAPAGAPVRRIVSLAPSTTEVLFALGAGDRIVGVDQFSDYPPAARTLPQVGNELAPSIERILALRPDVIFAAESANSRELVDQLRRLGLRVLVSHVDTLDDVWRDLAAIGAAVGRDEAAHKLIADGKARLAAVARSVAGKPRPRTLVVVWTDPLTVAGGHTFVDEAIGVAGGEDVAADSPLPYPQYSLERLLARAPEVIIVGSHAQAPSLDPIEAQATLPAVRNHRVHALDGDLLFRPGPRLVDGIEQLARLVHP